MTGVFTPTLTPRQKQDVADLLHRAGGVPVGSLASVFADVDVLAARALNIRRTDAAPRAGDVAPALAADHRVTPIAASFSFGFALGIRLGLTCIPPMRRAKHWISEEYKRLHEDNRRTVARFIRQLLRAQDPPIRKTRPSGRDAESARAWMQTAGRLARKGGSR